MGSDFTADSKRCDALFGRRANDSTARSFRHPDSIMHRALTRPLSLSLCLSAFISLHPPGSFLVEQPYASDAFDKVSSDDRDADAEIVSTAAGGGTRGPAEGRAASPVQSGSLRRGAIATRKSSASASGGASPRSDDDTAAAIIAPKRPKAMRRKCTCAFHVDLWNCFDTAIVVVSWLNLMVVFYKGAWSSFVSTLIRCQNVVSLGTTLSWGLRGGQGPSLFKYACTCRLTHAHTHPHTATLLPTDRDILCESFSQFDSLPQHL